MRSLTEILIGSEFESGLQAGASKHKNSIRWANWQWLKTREGLGATGNPPFLTPPEGNLKLDKAQTPSYGLTLQHYVQKLSVGLTINACPSAGDCTKVCVLDNGHGKFDMVQKARRMRTEFMALNPREAGVLIGHELTKAIRVHGNILFRPNVNSDVEWHKVAPSLTNGALFGDGVHSYGYSKLPSTMTEKVNTPYYTVAYSANEGSSWKDIDAFLKTGGNVAVVTSRKPKDPITQWYKSALIVDADKTDEWMLQGRGIIGDLSAKGKARKLIGTSGFVKELV